MNRREFLHLSAGALAMPGLTAWAFQPNDAKSRQSLNDLTAAEYHSLRKYAKTNQGRIAYIENGSGPVALLLHGFPLNSFQWRGVTPRLSAHRRCIAPDFLGLGYTETAEGRSVRPDAQVMMIIELLDKLSISTVDVVANDSGGAIAQLLVARHSNRVRTLLLTNCDTEPDSPPAAVLPVIALAREGKFADAWLAPWLADKALARSAKGIGGMCYADPTHPTDEAIDMYLGPLLRSAERKAQTNAYAVGLDPNPLAGVESALKACPVATRIVWGTADNIFSQTSPDYLDHTFGNSRGVRRVPGAKLFFPEEMPDLIAEEAMCLWRV